MDSQTNHQSGDGQLFIVATPIGNLADITYRAVDTLRSVDLIAAEDTRNSRKLLQHYAIDTPMITLHEHNEQAMLEQLKTRLLAGCDIALISDAGTPLISDPGYRLVRFLRQHGIRVTPIPGASSVITALCAAGLPTDHFRFCGFLPRSGKHRQQELQRIAAADETIILLESPRRLLDTLTQLRDGCGGQRQVVVARELTKLHESFISDTLAATIDHFSQHPPRGEIVLLVAPAAAETLALNDQQILDCLNSASMQSLPPSARAKAVANMLGIKRASVYALMTAESRD